jgi:filamentous hemagglutinin family protein
MKPVAWQQSVLGSLSISFLLGVSPTKAQITSDGTVGTEVNQSGHLWEIKGGTRAGDNLFHSFGEFSLPTNNTAFFNNSPHVANIISRVTGGSLSNIDGLIKANGIANLILINPSGVSFGANTQLDIGGSFLGSTASSIQFTDGTEYSAIAPQAQPLLTVSVPLGLQFNNPGAIRVKDIGHQLSFGADGRSPVERPSLGDRPLGLRVNSGETLALVGGNIISEGGILQIGDAGKLELGSVQAGEVLLNSTPTGRGWDLDYENVASFQNIELKAASVADVSDSSNGSIHLEGDRISITQGSILLLQNPGDINANCICINAETFLEVSGTTLDERSFVSTITTETFAQGKGGDISLSTKQLRLQDGGIIYAATYGAGTGGNITVNDAQSIQIQGFSPFVSTVNPGVESALATQTLGRGKGGDVFVNTETIEMTDGGFLGTLAFAEGQGGNLTINATESVMVKGTFPFINSETPNFPSTIGSFTQGRGNAGNTNLSTQRLSILAGGAVIASTFGSGNGGTVEVDATKSIKISGVNAPLEENPFFFTSSRLSAETRSSGNAGSVRVNTTRLFLDNGAVLNASTFSTGAAGEVIVNASELVEVKGTVPRIPISTFISSGALPNFQELDPDRFEIPLIETGATGNLFINTGELRILEGASVETSNLSFKGRGDNRGFLQIKANSIVLNNGFIAANSLSQREGGDIIIKTENLQLENQSRIAASSGLAAIELPNSDNILLPQFDISNSFGSGGNIRIDANDITLDNSSIIATSGTASDFSLDNPLRADLNLNRSASGGNITINANSIIFNQNSNIAADTQDGFGGNITFNTNNIALLDNSRITANALQGIGGDIRIATEGLFICSDCQISASSNLGVDGLVDIVTPNINVKTEIFNLPQQLINPEQVVALQCSTNRGTTDNEFAIIGRGGLPPRPTEPLNTPTIANFESLSASEDQASVPVQDIKLLPPPALGWYVNSQGVVVLSAQISSSPSSIFGLTSSNCNSQ